MCHLLTCLFISCWEVLNISASISFPNMSATLLKCWETLKLFCRFFSLSVSQSIHLSITKDLTCPQNFRSVFFVCFLFLLPWNWGQFICLSLCPPVHGKYCNLEQSPYSCCFHIVHLPLKVQ